MGLLKKISTKLGSGLNLEISKEILPALNIENNFRT
jgi:hypothetical protein